MTPTMQRPRLVLMPKPVDDIPRYYILVRQDLSVAVQLVQVAHAALTAGNRFELPLYHHLVFLGVSGERELVEAHEYLLQNTIANIAFFDPDSDRAGTPLGYTAICTEPLVGDRCRVLRRYRLWSNPAEPTTRVVG
jgi:hypothetical protein